jgi:hypothetical protein
MTALTAPRNTPQLYGEVTAYPVAANTTCHQGGLAVLNAGYAAPGTAATGLIAVGRFEASATAVSAGEVKVPVRRGCFRFGNSASADLIAQANVGADCYVVDDQTVALTSATSSRSRAGKIVSVDDTGVWVQIGLGS